MVPVRLPAAGLLLLGLLPGGPVHALVSGRVESEAGRPVEGAKVQTADAAGGAVPDAPVAWSDSAGRFRLAACATGCTLVAVHPRFEVATVEVAAPGSDDLVVVLVPKREVYEEIVVTAARVGADRLRPPTAAVATIRPEETEAPSTLADVVTAVPGVDRNGQGGIFQVVSIRGVSRQRIATLVAGAHVFGERRAGVSSSFVDPGLMQTVDVVRGPASTWYGSGALGGVIQVLPRVFEAPTVELSWDSHGDENRQMVGWSAGGWSLGVARRDRSADAAADGTPLHDGFTQLSASLRRAWDLGGRELELVVLPSLAEDVGKSSAEFPERISTYPREEHLVVRAALRSPAGWEAEVWAHPNTLETENLEQEGVGERVENEAFDLGGSWTASRDLGRSLEARYGFEWVARRGVTATESTLGPTPGGEKSTRTLDGASQDELSAFGALSRTFGSSTVEVGSRATWHRQDNHGAPGRDDAALVGFVGWARPVGGGVELFANVGTGLRFPSLSERFFTGATARGEIVANPDLDPERSLSTDLGLRWFGSRAHFSAQVFRNDVDDYIERIRLASGARTFVNLGGGTLEGVELDGFLQIGERWLARASAHAIEGEADDGAPLADVPPDRLRLGLEHRRGAWFGRVGLELRASKDDPGDSEVRRSGTELLDASLRRELRPGLALTLRGTNLLDRSWVATADDAAPLEAGRSIGVLLQWTPET